MSSYCRVTDCGAPAQGFICKPDLADLERVIAEWPSLLGELATLATRQTRVYRANGRDEQDEDDLIELDEEYAHRLARIPARLRSAQGRITLPATQAMVNPRAARMFHDAGNLIATWARHLAEARGLTLNLGPQQIIEGGRISRNAPTIGPTCPAHVHDFTPKGCGHAANDAGDPTCRKHQCRHWSCNMIRNGGADDRAAMLAGWLLTNLNAVQFDEAAAEIHREMTTMHKRMSRAVDRSPTRLFAGPCEHQAAGTERCTRPLYAWPSPSFDSDHERGLWEDDHPIVCDGHRPTFDRSQGYDPSDKGCGQSHSREQRRSWQLADIEDRLLPMSILQDALPGIATHLTWPKRTTWWRWTQLLQVKTVIKGVEFFRGGDVVALCTREQSRLKGNQGKKPTNPRRAEAF